MEFLDKKYGPFTGRLWGLFLNFFANAIALRGAIKYMLHNESPVEMYFGIIITVVVCMIVAVPVRKVV